MGAAVLFRSVEDIAPAIGTTAAPLLVDVRRQQAYGQDSWLIAGAIRRNPNEVGVWGPKLPLGQPAVVYCVHGHEVSQGVSVSLRALGHDASFLEGGIKAWREHKLALRRKHSAGAHSGRSMRS